MLRDAHQRPEDKVLDPDMASVLRLLAARLANRDVRWAIGGSLGLALQGVLVVPHDIDIVTDAEGAYALERLFPEFVQAKVAFSSTESIRSHFGALRIGGTKVEIIGDVQQRREDGTWDEPTDVQRDGRVVRIGDTDVPVLSLDHERRSYLRMGRRDVAELIGKVLRG